MNQLIVAKFGGTSVADFAAMQRCADIIIANPNTRLVVVSASAGVTNCLVSLAKGKLTLVARELELDRIRQIQFSILTMLDAPKNVEDALSHMLADVAKLAANDSITTNSLLKDELLSFGERMSSLLFTQVLLQKGVNAITLDVREVLKTDSRHGSAQPNIALTREQSQTRLLPMVNDAVVVTQGFIGSDELGNTTTLGRGGSDYSAALLAEALDADTLHIWTDVSGIFTTDPRLASNARPIPEISFDEAAEMATFGAKILHPATVIPAIRSGTRVFVGSSRTPDEGGTWISQQTNDKPPFRALALRRDQVLVTLKNPAMLHASGFLAEVFTIMARHKVSVDLISTSEISVAMTIDNPTNSTTTVLNDDLLNELRKVCAVELEDGLALVAVIGNNLQSTKGVSGKVLSAVQDYSLRMICQGASPNNLCFLAQNDDAQDIVASLHQALFED